MTTHDYMESCSLVGSGSASSSRQLSTSFRRPSLTGPARSRSKYHFTRSLNDPSSRVQSPERSTLFTFNAPCRAAVGPSLKLRGSSAPHSAWQFMNIAHEATEPRQSLGSYGDRGGELRTRGDRVICELLRAEATHEVRYGRPYLLERSRLLRRN